jgi:hypothetical protein
MTLSGHASAYVNVGHILAAVYASLVLWREQMDAHLSVWLYTGNAYVRAVQVLEWHHFADVFCPCGRGDNLAVLIDQIG